MEQAKGSKLFSTNKKRTNEFFKETKVNSCSHIIVKNGVSIAIPYQIKNERGEKLLRFKTTDTLSSETKSVYR